MRDRTQYAYDTEFLEDGVTIDLISIGIIGEDGREYYAVNADMPVERIVKSPWLMKNVVPSLPCRIHRSAWAGVRDRFILDMKSLLVKPRWVIANEVREFLLAAGKPTLWADHADYDHVVLAQLYGRMIDLPDGFPMWTHEIQQEIERHPDIVLPKQVTGLHNALEDARHNMRTLRALGVIDDKEEPPRE